MPLDAVTAPETLLDVFARLGGAALIGGVLGLDREIQDKPAGLRTHSLVALGASIFVLLPLQVLGVAGELDASPISRVLQGVVTGVGFIGGGVILHRGSTQEVYGLTTAATIWLAAALGAAMGLGLWRSSLLAVALGLVVLVLGSRLDSLVRRWAGDASDRQKTSKD